ncbi:hypothetical protein [Gordonia insulae]|nr:hypothetical protein [Gordonia insulae]
MSVSTEAMYGILSPRLACQNAPEMPRANAEFKSWFDSAIACLVLLSVWSTLSGLASVDIAIRPDPSFPTHWASALSR